MMKMEKPDLVLIFHKDLENSKGTADMFSRVLRANIPYRIFS
ncbi:hypothetical protein [Pseudobacteroides cellulosolvens]|nr:hypothetical protein [Pseudobacteroides cellulosolvens]